MKERLILSVDRQGDGSRTADYFDRCSGLLHELKFYDDMRRIPGLSLVYKYAEELEYISITLSLVMNLYLFSTVDSEYQDENTDQVASGERFTGLSRSRHHEPG